MASASQPETATAGEPGLHRAIRWMALTCTAAALFGVVTDPAQPRTPLAGREAGSPAPSRAPEIMRSARPTEPPPWTQRAVPKPLRQPSLRGHILIPAIGVDAPLIPLGLTSDGTLDVPKDWGVAGWFAGGSFPGEPGPAVVVGHVDSTRGPAVFYRLRELRRGDVIVVWRKGEIRSRFRVVSLRWFAKSAFPTQRVYGSVATPVLRLITCGGAFNRSTGHYVDNLVIFASPSTRFLASAGSR